MKVLFAGPSLHGCLPDHPGLLCRPPAAQGDLQAAVLEGARAIGLVDGLYESVAAVWHKEILFALSQGVAVLGAASLGALRAAECAAFGMVAVGEIAERYRTGALDDDAAVAQLHAPAELGFQPVTEALVDCAPAIDALREAGLVDEDEAGRLAAAAERLFFKERTFAAMLREAGIADAATVRALRYLKDRRTSIKRRDARLLVETLIALPDRPSPPTPGFSVARTQAWGLNLDATRTALAGRPDGPRNAGPDGLERVVTVL